MCQKTELHLLPEAPPYHQGTRLTLQTKIKTSIYGGREGEATIAWLLQAHVLDVAEGIDTDDAAVHAAATSQRILKTSGAIDPADITAFIEVIGPLSFKPSIARREDLPPAAAGYQSCVLCHGHPALGWTNLAAFPQLAKSAPLSQRAAIASIDWQAWDEFYKSGVQGLGQAVGGAFTAIFSVFSTAAGNPMGVAAIGVGIDMIGSGFVKMVSRGRKDRPTWTHRVLTESMGMSPQDAQITETLIALFGSLAKPGPAPSTGGQLLSTGGKTAPSSAALSRGAQLRQKLGSQFDEYMHFRGQGFTPAQSKYLTQPYGNRAGHHFPISQRVGRGLLPDAIVDSRFNVLKPRGISLGRFYELHYRVDPDFFGAPFPRSIGGSWSTCPFSEVPMGKKS